MPCCNKQRRSTTTQQRRRSSLRLVSGCSLLLLLLSLVTADIIDDGSYLTRKQLQQQRQQQPQHQQQHSMAIEDMINGATVTVTITRNLRSRLLNDQQQQEQEEKQLEPAIVDSLSQEQQHHELQQDYHNEDEPRRSVAAVLEEAAAGNTINDVGEMAVPTTSFEDLFKTIAFLAAVWFGANLCGLIGFPTLIGEIIAGIVLGPPLLDFCPFPDAMRLIGNFGLIGLILNSGVDLDIAQLKDTGTRAILLAVLGTIFALGTGFGVGSSIGLSLSIDSSRNLSALLAVGAAFAPSSWGVASQVLSKGQVLNTVTGQLIVATSVVDDILGLIMLSILQVFVEASTSPTALDIVKPFIVAFGYLFVLGGIGVTIFPRAMQTYVFPKLKQQQVQDWFGISIMFGLMIVYMPMMNYTGASYLTGAFIAGVSFSQLHHVRATFASTCKEIMVWLMRIFFASTIGFQVPIKMYFQDPKVLLWGVKFRKSRPYRTHPSMCDSNTVQQTYLVNLLALIFPPYGCSQ